LLPGPPLLLLPLLLFPLLVLSLLLHTASDEKLVTLTKVHLVTPLCRIAASIYDRMLGLQIPAACIVKNE